MHGTHESDERLVGADVGGCTVAANVLFSGGERQTVGFLAVNVDGTSNDTTGHQTQVGFGASEDTVQRTSTGDRAAERLTFADYDVRTVMTGCLNDPERDGLHAHDEGRVWTDDLFHGGEAFIENPERVGLFQVDAARACCFLECIEVKRSSALWAMNRMSISAP